MTNLSEIQRLKDHILEEDTFSGYIAHEVRNALQVLLLPLDSLDHPMSESDREQYKKSVKIGLNNLREVYNNVTKGIQDNMKSCEKHKAKFSDIREQIQGLTTLYKSIANEKKLVLTHVIDLEMPKKLIYDRGKIGQVLSNLISNSLKFTKSGGVFVIAEWKEVSSEAEIHDENILTTLLSDSARERVQRDFEGILS